MQIKCEYCQGIMDDTEAYCAKCGAANKNVKRMVDHTPQTIEELAQWYVDRGLPPYETTRFFIGIDYHAPKAFGIYKDGDGQFVVYKNKADGSRAIRYRGTDEAYAVNELYLKLKSEILNQKERSAGNKGNGNWKVANDDPLYKLKVRGVIAGIFIIMCLITYLDFEVYRGIWVSIFLSLAVATVLGVVIALNLEKRSGRKKESLYKKLVNAKGFFALWILSFLLVMVPVHDYKTNHYYYSEATEHVYVRSHYNDWYELDTSGSDYTPVEYSNVPSDVFTNGNMGSLYSECDDWNVSSFTPFEDSYSYDSYYPDSSSDSDYDWDSGDSWDSGGTDWGSDW